MDEIFQFLEASRLKKEEDKLYEDSQEFLRFQADIVSYEMNSGLDPLLYLNFYMSKTSLRTESIAPEVFFKQILPDLNAKGRDILQEFIDKTEDRTARSLQKIRTLSVDKPKKPYFLTRENSSKENYRKTDFTSARSALQNPIPRKKPRAPGGQFKTPYKKIDDFEAVQKECGMYNNVVTVNKSQDQRLSNIEEKIINLIKSEIMESNANIEWEDIAGLEHAKKTIKEIVVWPMLRPDIFQGLRGPPKGLLLFGPPGTGKTLFGKCIASQSKATFFSISASSLTSKWVGEGEKMVRALFTVARIEQPSVIFIDEIDSLLTSRTENEVEASRRIKTEFLVQFDGAGTSAEDRILVIGATNRPQEIDEAARRRLVKRLYIPLPEKEARSQIISNLLKSQNHCLSLSEITDISDKTEGYSGSDMDGLCREAALGPIRSIADITKVSLEDVRPINAEDFYNALKQVRASVSHKDLDGYVKWNNLYGSVN